MTDYDEAQLIAVQHSKDCWELFKCDHKIDLSLGVRCKGTCAEALKKYKKKESAYDKR